MITEMEKYNMKKLRYINNINIIYVLFFVLTGLASFTHAGDLLVSFTPEYLTILPGESETLQLNYDVLSGKKGTTGLTLRIHYNSKLISSVLFEDMYGEGLIGHDYTAKKDTKDLDNDPKTDKFLCIGWVGITGDWPEIFTPPMSLGKIIVQAMPDAIHSESFINITANSTPAGYSLNVQRMTVLIP